MFRDIPQCSVTFHNIPQHSTRFCHILSHCDIPLHSMMFHDIPQHSTTFRTVPGFSRLFHRVPPHSMVGPCGSMDAYLCMYVFVFVCLCVVVFGHVSLSSLGVALCGCVHKLVCEPMLCGLAVEPWGCVAGVVIAYLHSKYYKYSLC